MLMKFGFSSLMLMGETGTFCIEASTLTNEKDNKNIVYIYIFEPFEIYF